jgi:hypothetical protein
MFPKPSRTARKLQTRGLRSARLAHEQREKAKVRKRDKGCRFPLCGCRRLGLRLEVAHGVLDDPKSQHKGMGGNPKGDRSDAKLMVLLCDHRHQFSVWSAHAGTLRAVARTADGFDGPVTWQVQQGDFGWVDVAYETAPSALDRDRTARGFLTELAKMTL